MHNVIYWGRGGGKMADYKAMYLAAMDAMEQAVTLLIEAQRRCEELYVTSCAREEEFLRKNCHYDEKEGLTIGKKEIK